MVLFIGLWVLFNALTSSADITVQQYVIMRANMWPVCALNVLLVYREYVGESIYITEVGVLQQVLLEATPLGG